MQAGNPFIYSVTAAATAIYLRLLSGDMPAADEGKKMEKENKNNSQEKGEIIVFQNIHKVRS